MVVLEVVKITVCPAFAEKLKDTAAFVAAVLMTTVCAGVTVAVPEGTQLVIPVPTKLTTANPVYCCVKVNVTMEVVVPEDEKVTGALEVPVAAVPNGAELAVPKYVAYKARPIPTGVSTGVIKRTLYSTYNSPMVAVALTVPTLRVPTS